MPYVEVYVELDEFSDEELISELKGRKLFPEKHSHTPEIKSAKDEWKYELFIENFDKIQLEDIEAIVNK